MYFSINIPELTEHPRGFPAFWLNYLFLKSVSHDRNVNALTTTYMRLVEGALIDYRAGRERVTEFWNSSDAFRISAMHRSVSHFKSCLSAMYRATRCFRRLRRHPQLPEGLRTRLEAISASFVSDAVFDRVRDLRGAVHHTEEALLDGRIRDGELTALAPTGPEVPHATEANQTTKRIDRLELGPHHLLFRDLHKWLCEMGDIAEAISAFTAGHTSPT